SYAAPAEERTDRQLRNMFPAPLGKDGVPRWVPVEPLKVVNHSAVKATPLQALGVELDSNVDRDACVGTRPGAWIVFDVPDGTARRNRVGPRARPSDKLEQMRSGVSR